MPISKKSAMKWALLALAMAGVLTPTAGGELTSYLGKFDANNDKVLTRAEMVGGFGWFLKAGLAMGAPSQVDLSRFQKDKTVPCLTKAEIEGPGGMASVALSTAITFLFKMMDSNGDGAIALAPVNSGSMFSRMDADGDGSVTMAEMNRGKLTMVMQSKFPLAAVGINQALLQTKQCVAPINTTPAQINDVIKVALSFLFDFMFGVPHNQVSLV